MPGRGRREDHELKARLAYIVRPYLIFDEKTIMVIIITAIIKNLKLKTTIPKRQTDFLKAIHSHKKQSRELLTTANLGCLINDILVFGGRYRNWPCWKPREIYPKAIRFCITLLGKTLKAVQKKKNTSFSLSLAEPVCTWVPKAGTAC